MRTLLLLAATAWGFGIAARAQSLDPLTVDPPHYKLELENQWTRVFRELMKPRDTMPMHQHPPPGSVIVFLTDRHNRLTAPDGTSRELRDHAGDVMWAVASTHRSENLTDAPFEAVQIEPRSPAGTKGVWEIGPADATVIDPQHYHVELENEWVRVLRVSIGPHEKLARHTHPPTGAVLVHLTDQNLRLTLADGTTRESRYAARQIHWTGVAAAHQDENLSDAPLRFIRVELKKALGAEP